MKNYTFFYTLYFINIYVTLKNEGFLEVHAEGFHALKLNTLLQNIDFKASIWNGISGHRRCC